MASTCNAAPNCAGYRPREAFLSPLWRLVSDHLDGFLRHYEERHLASHGTLGIHVEGVLNQFLDCGDPNRGLTLLRCMECNTCLAVPFSCKTRICPPARPAEPRTWPRAWRLPSPGFPIATW